MKWNWQRTFMLTIFAFVFATPSLFAQKYEFGGYAGGYWPFRTNVGDLKSQGFYGARGGVFVGTGMELEGNVGYYNQFEVEGTDPRSRGWLFEFAPTYNFMSSEWGTSPAFTPYATFGLGFFHTKLDSAYSFSNGIRTINVNPGDRFFEFSYGGGIKSIRVWGPIGMRFDGRGRTIPNYYHSSPTWFEASAGVNVMW
ncbi:MAG TPA: hypothetical protein VFY29_13895 [Terriglobia bacterium]|nr:hypothetical protein [Terriglobia bacterium]